MLTLQSKLRIPAHVYVTNIKHDLILLNAQTNKYFSLNEVGARFCQLLKDDPRVETACKTMLKEYQVSAEELEKDILDLAEKLLQNNLIESA